jgi:hypothetical protein
MTERGISHLRTAAILEHWNLQFYLLVSVNLDDIADPFLRS